MYFYSDCLCNLWDILFANPIIAGLKVLIEPSGISTSGFLMPTSLRFNNLR